MQNQETGLEVDKICISNEGGSSPGTTQSLQLPGCASFRLYWHILCNLIRDE
jgi:hypothetical protein